MINGSEATGFTLYPKIGQNWPFVLLKKGRSSLLIQRSATKFVLRLKYPPYEKRLHALKLISQDFGRRRGDMIQVMKIMNGLDRLDPEIFFLRAEGRCTRGHKDKLLVCHNKLEVRKNVFIQRIVQEWNSFSEGTVAANKLNIFKTRLDKQCQARRYEICSIHAQPYIPYFGILVLVSSLASSILEMFVSEHLSTSY